MDWNVVIKLIGELVLVLISTVVIPWIKAKVDADKLEKYLAYAEIAVGAAEQLAAVEGLDGEWKKAYVMKFLTEKCGMGNLDVDVLNNIIENAVIMLHNELGTTE